MMGGLIHLLPTLDDGAPRPPAAWLDQLEDTLVLHLLYNQPNTWRGGRRPRRHAAWRWPRPICARTWPRP